VREAELRVAQQEAIIALLDKDRLDATEARNLLATFKKTLVVARKRLRKMLDGRV
jgi:hypothetical protein